ncbi:uncharacterized protein LOC132142024 [Carassius carassius]|uniref:uncharacterized protein LOC132142024 n=1 Tax=Carassius carassius TaxID=217509 RepID=UPI002868C6B0|nr:uncharacterized protein LOC132142024 [Carassius carassius]
MVRILNNVFDLKETRFGQPRPRHGLNLLWWFAHDCVQIDSNHRMTAKCDPANGAFGFHRFYNNERLLPEIDLPYYEVGNLSTPGSLPLYVTRHYTGQLDSSNKDRIIVSFDSIWKRFKKIYVTQHSNQVRFDQNHTYCISIDLLRNIQALSLQNFYREPTNGSGPVSISIPKSVQTYTFQSRPTGNKLMKNIQESTRIHFHRELNASGHVSISIPKSVQTNTFQSRPTSNEHMKNIQESTRIHFHREPTNGSGHVSISIPKSVQTNTFQSRPTSNELMKNIQESSRIHFHREPTNDSGRVSISRPQSVPDVPQSVQDNQTNSCQSISCPVLICFIVLMLLAAAVYVFFKII